MNSQSVLSPVFFRISVGEWDDVNFEGEEIRSSFDIP